MHKVTQKISDVLWVMLRNDRKGIFNCVTQFITLSKTGEKHLFIRLKITQIELLSFFYFMCLAANAPELFCMAHLADI